LLAPVKHDGASVNNEAVRNMEVQLNQGLAGARNQSMANLAN